MTLFRKRTKTSDDAPGERHCSSCGSALATDQLACLECGAVDESAGRRDRRLLLPTGGLVAVALLLVTSASFAANTALNTGDPHAVKKQEPPPFAQVTPPLPPVSGDGTAPASPADPGTTPTPPATPPAAAPATPAPATPAPAPSPSPAPTPAPAPAPTPKPPKEPKPEPAKISEWKPADGEGYTVIVYKFDGKAAAKLKAREVAGKGLPAGVLQSDDFASLDPGSWLVFIGQFDSAKQADKASRKYENAGYPGEVTFVGNSPTPESTPPSGDSASPGSTDPSTNPQP
jgi:predicted nucleic acid-binding Zn ribbon protein